MENECKLLSSKGILKSCCMHPGLEKYSASPHGLTYRVDKSNVSIRNTPSIYINTASLDFFIKKILPGLKAPVVLVTGDSDIPIPNEIINITCIEYILSNPKIKGWYCQNLCYKLDNLYPLPIGLDYHTLSYTNKWESKTMTASEQENILSSIKKTSKPFWERKNKCYINFQFTMHHESGELIKYGDIRKSAINKIDESLCYFENKKISRNKTWSRQREYAFVVSPPGNGLDCHRTWEALQLGCIPIIVNVRFGIEKLKWQNNCYDDLPVLIIDKWEDITQELLDDTIAKFKKKNFNYEKLTLKYWVDKIHE